MLKGLLQQLVLRDEEQNVDLLPACHEKAVRGDRQLQDIATVKSLLELFCEADINQFIIIDGLDECDPAEIRQIVHFWMSMVKKCDAYKPGKLRVLFISQDMGKEKGNIGLMIKRVQGQELTELKLGPEHVEDDIRKYVAKNFNDLQQKHGPLNSKPRFPDSTPAELVKQAEEQWAFEESLMWQKAERLVCFRANGNTSHTKIYITR